ncbi:hypothetical protein [Nocardia salmonicida]|uniref:hypothetical protein n=1 Tax=Nocardia salmonicida TaxID=53431 RepID=UPI0033E943DE
MSAARRRSHPEPGQAPRVRRAASPAAAPEELGTGALFARNRCRFHEVCAGWVLDDGQVCRTCLAEFGDYLQRLPDPGPAVDDAPAQATDRPADTHGDRAAPSPAEQAEDTTQEPERRNQRCWLCEDRRTCVEVAGRWECRRCRQLE